MHPELLRWAKSLADQNVTEIAVLSPIKPGRVPGERQTYEQRARGIVESLQSRVEARIPNVLSKVPSIHFGRTIFIRPEQYLDATCTPDYGGTSDTDELEDPSKKDLRTHLLTLVEFDGDIRVYFRDIATKLNTDFDIVFENCENYPRTCSFERFWLWIRRYQMPTHLFLSPYANLSVVRIKQLEQFKRRFDEFVATKRSSGGWPKNLDALLDQFIKENHQHSADFPTGGGIYR